MNHWKNFTNDRWYLVKYLLLHTLVILIVISLQLRFAGPGELTAFDFELWQLLLLPAALILAVMVPVLIHNCVHRNLRPRFLNFIAGELAGYYVLLSMASFELNHLMHHSHPDSALDPHNPHRRNFLNFFFANNFAGTRVVLVKFLESHGDTFYHRRVFDLSVVIHFINVPLRLASWFLLLGPTLFVVLFIPSYLFHMFVFAHINYVTHATHADGRTEVFNFDSNLYYRFVNFFGSGVYYHLNHHHNPRFYNPKRGASSWIFIR
ncbi:MAG TPA: fatty acid desaturase [Bacteriovoracaceae bacterium]|nr:fatty acid desaturase [Bacteriovoracaceae bacterium]